MTFRLGMLASILGNGLLTGVGRRPAAIAIQALTLFFAFGLATVAVARIDQKAVGSSNSTGAVLPWSRVTQLGMTIAATLAIPLWLIRVYNPAALRTALSWFSPLWIVVRWLLLQLLVALFVLIAPLLERLALYIRSLIDQTPRPPPAPPVQSGNYVDIVAIIREWTILRYCLVTLAIVFVLGLIWLFFMRTRLRIRAEEVEEVHAEEIGFGTGLSRGALDPFRAWINLLRRHGLSNRLLAAISVQNIYANLGRLARQRGFPRRPAQPPDAYLVLLQCAFPDQAERLQRITAVYMRVHYGDQAIARSELEQLRDDYIEIIKTNYPDDPQVSRR